MATSVIPSSIPSKRTIQSSTIGVTGIAESYVLAGVAFLKIYDFKPTTASGDMGTIPAALRPANTYNGVVMSADGANACRITVNSSGTVSFNGADTSKYHYGTIVYPVV